MTQYKFLSHLIEYPEDGVLKQKWVFEAVLMSGNDFTEAGRGALEMDEVRRNDWPEGYKIIKTENDDKLFWE